MLLYSVCCLAFVFRSTTRLSLGVNTGSWPHSFTWRSFPSVYMQSFSVLHQSTLFVSSRPYKNSFQAHLEIPFIVYTPLSASLPAFLGRIAATCTRAIRCSEKALAGIRVQHHPHACAPEQTKPGPTHRSVPSRAPVVVLKSPQGSCVIISLQIFTQHVLWPRCMIVRVIIIIIVITLFI